MGKCLSLCLGSNDETSTRNGHTINKPVVPHNPAQKQTSDLQGEAEPCIIPLKRHLESANTSALSSLHGSHLETAGSFSGGPVTDCTESAGDVYVRISLAPGAVLVNGERSAMSTQRRTGSVAQVKGSAGHQAKSRAGGDTEKIFSDKLNVFFDTYWDVGSGEGDRLRGGMTRHQSDVDKQKSDEDCMHADGIERLCADLDVKPEEYRVLVLAWNLRAATMCRFTREEFVTGCRRLGVDNVTSMRAAFPRMLEEVRSNRASFREMYRWAYRFALDAEAGQRTLPIDMATSLWQLVFTESKPQLLDRWLEFLDQPSGVPRGITRDTWDMFLNFVDAMGGNGDSLASYDETEAWPSLFDDFVEWMAERTKSSA